MVKPQGLHLVTSGRPQMGPKRGPIWAPILDFWIKYGIKWIWEGFRSVQGCFGIHLDQVSAQMDHSGSIWGRFLGPFIFPKVVGLEICCRGMWSKYSYLSYMKSWLFWAHPALTGTHGGRRPTFWRPKADAGGSGSEAPRKKTVVFLMRRYG